VSAEQHRDRGVPPLVALRQRVDRALQWRGYERKPGSAVEEGLVVGDQQVEHDRGDEQPDRREVAAQALADNQRERHGEQAADDRRADPRQREGQLEAADVGLEAPVGAVGRK
jgi:hypothetical protein